MSSETPLTCVGTPQNIVSLCCTSCRTGEGQNMVENKLCCWPPEEGIACLRNHIFKKKKFFSKKKKSNKSWWRRADKKLSKNRNVLNQWTSFSFSCMHFSNIWVAWRPALWISDRHSYSCLFRRGSCRNCLIRAGFFLTFPCVFVCGFSGFVWCVCLCVCVCECWEAYVLLCPGGFYLVLFPVEKLCTEPGNFVCVGVVKKHRNLSALENCIYLSSFSPSCVEVHRWDVVTHAYKQVPSLTWFLFHPAKFYTCPKQRFLLPGKEYICC